MRNPDLTPAGIERARLSLAEALAALASAREAFERLEGSLALIGYRVDFALDVTEGDPEGVGEALAALARGEEP
jgi:hypothetical protein